MGREEVLSCTMPVKAYGEVIGYCNLKQSLSKLNLETYKIVGMFSALLLSLLVIMSVMLNLLMARSVLEPVYRLKSIMLRVKPGREHAGTEKDKTATRFQSVTNALPEMASDLSISIGSKDEIGDLARSFKVMVSELEDAYNGLLQAERKYRGLFENAIEGIFQLHPDGTLMDANGALARVFGYDTSNDLLNQIHDLGHQCFKHPENLDAFLSQARSPGGVSGMEMEFLRRDKTSFWGSMSAVAIMDDQGGLDHFEGTLVDITERMEKERAQVEREAAQAAANARSEFLDNSGEGFLSFGPDLKVDDEFSRECTEIFGGPIGGMPIGRVLGGGIEYMEQIFTKNFNRIFKEKDEYKRGLYLSLMPRAIRLGEKALEAEYRLVATDKMMLILTDVTRQKILEDEITEERNKLKFVVAAVRESRDFFDILDEYDAFASSIPALLEGPADPEEALAEVYRKIHTLKGLFSQHYFISVPSALHKLETALDGMRQSGVATPEDLGDLLRRAGIDTVLQKDLGVIHDVLGSDFMERRGQVAITREQAESLKILAENLLSRALGEIDQETKSLLDQVRHIRSVELRDLLSSYPKGTLALAKRLEKPLRPFEIEGDHVPVDPDRLRPFAKSLVHVFRNAVDHGIETPDEREEAGKSEEAAISCRIGRDVSGIFIEIADDGRGLDAAKLRQKAVAQGLIDRDEADGMPDREIFRLVFADALSTRDDITALSGRGVGLSALMSELRRLGGDVEITSEPGKGTSFRFVIPDLSA